VKQVLKGTSEAVFAIFTFAGSSGIDDTMLALARDECRSGGFSTQGQAAQDWAASKTMIHPNIKLFIPKRTGAFKDLRKLHHKLMVIASKCARTFDFDNCCLEPGP
jgi:hypothetical protein